MKPLRYSFSLIPGLLLFVLSMAPCAAQRRTPLSPVPDWSLLTAQGSGRSSAEIEAALNTIYAPGGAWRSTISLNSTGLSVKTQLNPPSAMQIAVGQAEGSAQAKPARRWRMLSELPSAPEGKPLAGLVIALDPGHLGGKWARMEERWFQIGQSRPVLEGDMTLLVARFLKDRLTNLGAKVVLTRTGSDPATKWNPRDLYTEARGALKDRGVEPRTVFYRDWNDPHRGQSVQAEAEKLFYRVAEIHERARRLNSVLRPDIALAIHFNADPWGDPVSPTLVPQSHLHLLVNGSYSLNELTYDDVRFAMVSRLLAGTDAVEIPLAEALAVEMAAATGLPPYVYPGDNAKRISRYVWARNLLANRLFDCPTVYLEPYVMNNFVDHARMQAGDFTGERMVAGANRRSIYREYADSVAAGLVRYATAARGISH